MDYLRRLYFRTKILFLIVPAIVGLLILGFMQIAANSATSSSASAISHLTELSAFNNALVHELQKERGATAAFLGSKGKNFGDILRSQRQQTDRALQQRNSYLDDNKDDIDNQKVINQLDSIANGLSRLKSTRTQIDNLAILLGDALKFYTDNHAKMIHMTAQIAELAKDGTVANQLVAYYNFLEGKERAGIERAVMSIVFTADEFKGKGFSRFVTLVTEQNTYFSVFTQFADETLLNNYQTALNHASVKYVDEKRALAMDKAAEGGFSVDSKQWFTQATGRINQLKKVEDQIAEHIKQMTGELAAAASSSLLTIVVAGSALLAMIVLLAMAIGTVITTQVMAVSNIIIAVETNNDLTLRIDVSTSDELGNAAVCINKMFDTFQDAIKDIEHSSALLATSSEETSATTDSNLQNLHLQQDESQLVATAIEEMSASVQQVATSTSQTAALVLNVDTSVDESVVDITHSRNEMEKLSQEMAQANDLIGQLQNSSSNINSVVEVIKSVAEQTNLLALNAAIEAARAGEQGRGFAVVADEVRTLAQRTQESTAEIETMVGKFQLDANSVSTSIAKCSKEVDVAVGQTQKLESKLNEIKDAATAITGMTAQIATATEEQVAVASEMATNVNSINDLSEQNATSGSQLAAAGREQTELASNLAELSNRFKC